MKDPALRSVSIASRGLWIDMLCLMFESSRRGYLQQANGQSLSLAQLARMTGCSTDEAAHLVRELEDAGVCSRTEHGILYSRRLVREETKREGTRNRVNEFREREKEKERYKTGYVTPDVTPMKQPSSSSSSTTEQNAEITPEMVTRSVLTELGLSGRDLSVVLDEVCRSHMKLYETPDALRDALMAAWKDYDLSKPQMTQYTKGPAKFFGDGDWKNKTGWPWKDGKKPAGRRYVNE